MLFQLYDSVEFKFNKSSPDAIEGYQDYTCSEFATLITDKPYNLTITTGVTYVETVRAWLDMNNDGVLDTTTELIWSDTSVFTNHTGAFVIPNLSTNVYGKPLRLRLASEYSVNAAPTPCRNLKFGQVEDYSVFLNFLDGINEFINDPEFVIYPNPFTHTSTIEYNLKKSSTVSVEVYNLIGERETIIVSAEKQSMGKKSYQFEEKASGIYFVKFTIDGLSRVQKVIKM